jgi:hypothetical protein
MRSRARHGRERKPGPARGRSGLPRRSGQQTQERHQQGQGRTTQQGGGELENRARPSGVRKEPLVVETGLGDRRTRRGGPRRGRSGTTVGATIRETEEPERASQARPGNHRLGRQEITDGPERGPREEEAEPLVGGIGR